MADQDDTTASKNTSLQCSTPHVKAKYQRAADRLKWKLHEVVDFAGDLLEHATADEETPEDRKARMLGKLG